MSTEDYKKACKMGRRNYNARLLQGKKPTLEVLDEILPSKGALSQVSLGLVQIPIDQIVGTRYEGRSGSFASNFMPILDEKTEFANKWSNLSTAHEEEGIRDPIKAYEYMNKFYVEEGNKRVSVMKFFQADSIPGNVTRILPPRTQEKKNRIYYEFVDFYRYARINYIWFTRLGSFAKLQAAVGKEPEDLWTDDDRTEFSSVYTHFSAAFKARGGEKLTITTGDAFLAYIELYGYETAQNQSAAELKEALAKCWEEFQILQEDDEISLHMDPSEEKEKKPLLSRLLPGGKTTLKVGFIYEKTVASSAWTYSHELGRIHLEQTFPGEITTVGYQNITADTVAETIEQAIADGCNLIFTTTPAFAQASVKAAIEHPHVRILNCSLNTSHRYIRTYYARMHEAKFLMGAIAGAMAENNRILYLADYPMFGTIAHINAFALGAKMINPRAQVYLEWSTQKGIDINEKIWQIRPDCISGRDMVIPDQEVRYFGLYHRSRNGHAHNLAMPLCHWGKFYERLIRTIMDGTWKNDDDSGEAKAINYWWGMSSGVVDVICSQNLPIGTQRLVGLLEHTIKTGQYNPFQGQLYSQTGIIQNDPNGILTPEQVLEMDWLAENVTGRILPVEDLPDQAQPALSQQGVQNRKAEKV